MKFKTAYYNYIFAMLLFLQLYLPSFKINVILQLGILIIFFLSENKLTISIWFLNKITPLLLLFTICFLGMLVGHYKLFNIIKDIFHLIKPILGICIGYFFYKKINNLKKLIITVVLLGFLSAITHLLLLIFFIKTITFAHIRDLGKDNFLELFALFFILFYKRFFHEKLFSKKSLHPIIIIVLATSSILYFSRTMFVCAILILLTIFGYSKITARTIKFLSVVAALTTVLFVYLNVAKPNRNGDAFESFLYKVYIAPSEIFKTNINRDNHEDLWDHWRGYEAKRAFAFMTENPTSFVFGGGYGSLINLKFLAPLTDDIKDKGLKFISELHNGFMYILYKTGIIGTLIYLSFLIGLYKYCYLKQTFLRIFISSVGLIYIFTTLTITGLYNTRDIIVFILGALLYFEQTSNNYKTL